MVGDGLEDRIREKIFANMAYSDRLLARLVCHQWNKSICTQFSFKVILNDESPELNRILKLPIYSCKIERLLKLDWDLKRIRFPTILHELRILGPITLSNFEVFLDGQHLLTNLRSLVISTDQVQESDGTILVKRKIRGVSPNFGFGIPFPMLQSLSLQNRITSHIQNTETLSNRIFNLFLLSRFQQLREFILMDWHCPSKPANSQPNSLVRLLRFIARHTGTLSSLSINCTEIPVIPVSDWKGIPCSIGMTNLKRVPESLIKDFQVKRFHLSPYATGIGHLEWAAILYKQNKLKFLSCHFQVCPFSFYTPVVLQNSNQLKELTLSNLSCWDGIEFQSLDLTPIGSCTRLELLSLSRYVYDYAHSGSSSSGSESIPEMFNTRKLPPSLTVLSISGFQLLTEDVYDIGRHQRNLERLVMEDTGSSQDFGMTGQCCREMLKYLPKLKYIRIRGVNVEGEADKVAFQHVITKMEPTISPSSLEAIGNYLSFHMFEWDLH